MPWAPNSVGRCTKQASLEEAAAGELVACMVRTEGSVCDTSSHPQGAPENPSAWLQGLSHSLPAAWHVLKPLAPLQLPENPSGPLRAGVPHLSPLRTPEGWCPPPSQPGKSQEASEERAGPSASGPRLGFSGTCQITGPSQLPPREAGKEEVTFEVTSLPVFFHSMGPPPASTLVHSAQATHCSAIALSSTFSGQV